MVSGHLRGRAFLNNMFKTSMMYMPIPYFFLQLLQMDISNTNNGNNINRHQTPSQTGSNKSVPATPAIPSSQSYVAGEVALTPTHSSCTPQAVNPHSAMTAITPMVSGTNQARNSIKVQ